MGFQNLLFALSLSFSITQLTANESKNFASMGLGAAHACILVKGLVKCWGNNDRGQLGLGDFENRGDQPSDMGSNLPYVDLGERKARFLSVGDTHNCVILEEGLVKCWGSNQKGQLGLGDTFSRGGKPHEMGESLPVIDLDGEKARSLATSLNHSCALLENGKIKCWGRGGRLGLGDSESRGDDPGEMGEHLDYVDIGSVQASSIAVGNAHTCVLLKNGAVKCWGMNGVGLLGLGDTRPRGNLPNEMGENLPPVDLGAKALQLVAGYYHTCALLNDHSVKCWGANGQGQLGLGDKEARGDQPNEMGIHLPRVELGDRKVLALSAGGDHTCALFDEGSTKCWGGNRNGQLGVGDTLARGDQPFEMGIHLPKVDLGIPANSMALGFRFGCAVLVNHSVKCWGRNKAGAALGIGEVSDKGTAPNQMGNDLPYVHLTFES